MELAAILSFLSEKTPEFIAGTLVGLIVGLFVAYVYLLPRLIKASTAALTSQIELLTAQVTIQTGHIEHLETQVRALENELEPYKEFAKQHIARVMAIPAEE